jgi:hypothetical protein
MTTKKTKQSKRIKKQVKTQVKKHKVFNEAAFYEKYPWVVEGSVKEMKPGTKIDGIVVAHGRICYIKCQETGTIRTVNVQDAFQVKYCEEVQSRRAREKAAARRAKK